jgi:hypothetical protein
MSPAIAARFPRYLRIVHGRQSSRSIHLHCLCAFGVFFVGHVTMVALHGFLSQWALIVLGETHNPNLSTTLVVGLIGIAVIVGIHVAATLASLRRPRRPTKDRGASPPRGDPARVYDGQKHSSDRIHRRLPRHRRRPRRVARRSPVFQSGGGYLMPMPQLRAVPCCRRHRARHHDARLCVSQCFPFGC